ncbi:MAG: DUF6468 domain-containing protein [Pseudomonadota bacterium]
MGNILSLFLDVTIIGLLIAVIVQAARLSRKLTVLREARKEMDATIKQFFEASAKAELAIRNFHKAAGETSQKLDGDTKRAQLLTDELKLMIDSGNGLAERLEAVVEGGRALPGHGEVPATEPAVPSKPPPLAANQPVDQAESRDADAPAPGSIEAAAADGDGDTGEGRTGRGENRSRAEQELLKALQNMR